MAGNGDNVTWRELNLALDPIKDDLRGIATDVRSLLEARAETRGAHGATKDFSARRLSLIALVVAAAGSLWWIPAAVGH